MIKAQISVRMISSGISGVVIASVYSEKMHLKKLIMIIIMIMIMIMIIIMNKSQELMVFHVCQKLTTALKQRPEK